MNKRWTGYAAAALTASLAFGTVGTTYGATLTLAGFGADQEVEETKVEVVTQPETQPETQAATEAPQTEAPQTEAAQTEAPQTEAPQTEAPQTEAPIDKSMVNTTAFAKSDEPISVYVSGDTEGEVVGTLNKNDKVEILDVDENGWALIRSGNVEGWAAMYKLATGEEAEAAAQEAAYNYAKIGAEYLNIRSDASEEAEVLDTVDQTADLEIVEDCGAWLKVATSDGLYGYVSSDFVSQETAYSTGETVQEQSEREEQEYIEYVEQQEAEYAAYVAQQESEYAEYVASQPQTEAAVTETQPAETTDTTAATTTTTDTTTVAASGDVDALYQAYLAAHEASLSATDEADAMAKAQASIDAYNAYLAALGSSQTVPSVTAPTTTDSTAAVTDTTTDTTTQTEAPQTEAPQTEAPQTTDTTTTSTSTGSSTGAAVAAYACQFVGNPYVYGGTSLTNGCDCSGFTMSVYANFGVSLPHNAAAQSGCGTSVSTSDLQPGDLIFYGDGGIGHVAIYCGNGTVVHASNEETGIKYSSYNYRTPVAAVRLV